MELFFKGKEFVYNHHLTIPFRPLIPHVDKSIGDGNLDENLIIQGDNLHALKALLPQYAGKVDCIFIDPPYNTKNQTWRYNDNVNSPIMREWLSNNPVNSDDMLRHDKWCAMMWPRLVLLRELLTEEGIFWMSIDDNEVYRARMMLNEIFGEDQFLAQFIWKSRKSEDARDKTGASIDHEYIICFNKSKGNRLKGSEADQSKFSNPDDDPRGPWRSADMTGLATREQRPNLHYDLIDEVTGINYGCPPKGWRFDQESMRKKIEGNKILWPASSEGRPRQKLFLKDVSKNKNISSLITDITTSDGTKELSRIFSENASAFDFPKPSDLILFLLEQSTEHDSLILDSFAGSGTTAHAVMKLNDRDEGSRRFILVECEDYVDTLTAERVRRVMNGYSFTGKHREEILRDKLTWTKFQRASNLLHQISGLEALHAPNFDRIKKEIKDGELIVTGEKDITGTKPGLGGSFTFCTLGEAVDMDALLTGANLPDYAALGAWVFYIATNQTLPTHAMDPANFYLGESSQYHVWLIYKPDLEFLKSNDSALTLSRAENIARTHRNKRHLVFAPVKFVPNKTLLPLGIEFAQLPYAIYRREQA